MSYYIYKITNKINNKIYIGQTKSLGTRIRQHIIAKDKSLLHEAINEFGYKNFTWEFLDIVETSEIACELEEKYIKDYDCRFPNGYNITLGGKGSKGNSLKPIIMLDKNGKFIQKFNSANEAYLKGYGSVRCILDNCKNRNHSVNKHLFMFEDDYKKNGGKIYEKPHYSFERKIIQCDLQGNKINEFDSIIQASIDTNSSRTSIVGNLKGRYKTCNGFIFVYEEDFPIKDLSSHKFIGRGKRVAQVDKNTNEIINVFDSMTEAARVLGGDNRCIQKALDNPKRTSLGYKWISQ